MRAPPVVVVIWPLLLIPATALAQDLCTGPMCPGGVCVSEFDGALPVCVPAACASGAAPLVLRSACFGGADTDPVARFAVGDCDGDLISNGAEIDARAICDGGVVAQLSPAGGFPTFTSGQRLVTDEGGRIAPDEVRSRLTTAIGIGCSTSRPCPHLPGGSPGLAPRCVFLDRVGAEERGVCTYYVEPRDDHSCVGPTSSGEALSAACVATDFTEPHERWEHGDCDGDGLINKLDNAVCSRVSIVGLRTPGQAACVPGRVVLSGDDCTAPIADVTSDRQACPSDPMNRVAAFGFCCRSHADCPIEDVDPPFDRGFPRCVRLATFGGEGGVCTYNGSMLPDDTTCVTPTAGLAPGCLTDFTDVPEYQNWVDGNCDGCEELNRTDEAVCACRPDTGVSTLEDAFVGSEDGGNAQLEDAAAGDVDAGAAVAMDAAASEPRPAVTFAGSGCRCAATGLPHRPPVLAWLFVVALGVRVGRPLLRRRER